MNSSTKTKCPVELIGKNSVIPSTIPKIIALIISNMKTLLIQKSDLLINHTANRRFKQFY
jgi:hypothetical protein